MRKVARVILNLAASSHIIIAYAAPAAADCVEKPSPLSLRSSYIVVTNVRQDQKAINVYWLDRRGARHYQSTLTYGQNHQLASYVGHHWVVTDQNGRCLQVIEVQAKGVEFRIGS